LRELMKNKPILIMTAAILLLVILALFSSGERRASLAENIVGGVLEPVQEFADSSSRAIVEFVKRLFKQSDLDKQLEQASLQLERYKQSQSSMEELELENERLKALLKFVESNPENSYITAGIIAKSQSVWYDSFTINAGRKDGITENAVVLTSDGLVGRVTEVAARYSKVCSIIDTSSAVSVMVQRTRDNGMVRGLLNTADDNQLELYYLPTGSDLVPGDVIVTNGLGGIFPKGLIIGMVTEVSSGDDADRNAIVKPAVDFSHLEEVLIITGEASE